MKRKELEEMNLEELKAELKKKEELFEEVEEERVWMLTGTTKHVPGSTTKKYELELSQIRKTIETIQQLIKTKE